ncbi:MAG: deoxyribonuclease IV, partial [Spirochaetes bacterium]|nr:deoxyribonuclease IV [Spirochaetota bacterium]
MRYIGVHVSIAGGVFKALQRARALDVNTVQIFLKNAKKWSSPQFKDKEIDRFHYEKNKFEDIKIFAHTGYLINLASRGLLFNQSYKSLIDDFRRADSLGIEYLVVHPGNHNGKGVAMAVERIAKALNKVFKRMTHTNIKILLETTSGNGTAVGYRFEHLRDIIGLSKYSDRIGVCLDTCHIFAAGYPIADPDGF